MSELDIEFLSVERVQELEDTLTDLFKQSCEGNEISKRDLTPKEIIHAALTGNAAIFVGSMDRVPKCVLAIQFFIEAERRKGATILGMAGKHLLKFKQLYWDIILDWLRANKVEVLDAYVDEQRAKVYLNKFGFDRSCALVRMDLMEVSDGRVS